MRFARISGIPNLTTLDLAYASSSTITGLLAAAHVIGSGGISSCLNPIEVTQAPEPVPISLLGIPMLLLAASRLRDHFSRRRGAT